jgi:hypothetical protein
MPTPFAARDAKLSGAIDRAFGEVFTFTPYKKQDDVNLPRAADGARAAFTAKGTFDDPARSSHPNARGVASDHAQGRIVEEPIFECTDEALLWRPLEGDRATRAYDGAIYEVAKALPDGFGRTQIWFTARK